MGCAVDKVRVMPRGFLHAKTTKPKAHLSCGLWLAQLPSGNAYRLDAWYKN